MDRKDFASNLKKCRRDSNVTIKGLAEISGVSQSTIAMTELGKRNLGVDSICKLMDALECESGKLFDSGNLVGSD